MSPLTVATTGPEPQQSPSSPTLPSALELYTTRTIYFGVKRGRVPGVYTSWKFAEAQIADFEDACIRCFSTRYAALAYIGGWDCKGGYSLPKGSPYPLYEYLLVHFSTPQYLLSPLRKTRGAYQHPRASLAGMNEFGALPSVSDAHPSLAGSSNALSHRASSSTLRPPPGSHRNSWRASMVKSPSPLRHQVDEPVVRPRLEKVHSVVGAGGIHTPPSSPERKTASRMDGESATVTSKEKKRSSIFALPSFTRKQTAPAGKSLTAADTTALAPPLARPNLRATASSPNLLLSSQPLSQRPPSRLGPNRQSGLWSSPTPPLPPAPSQRPTLPSPRNSFHSPVPPKAAPAFTNTDAPTFSRAAMRKSGVILPASAPRRSPSIPSLSPSSSTSSISTISSISSNGFGWRSSTNLSTPKAKSDFAPPRASFMGRPSSLSLIVASPSASCESVATITTGSSVYQSGTYPRGSYSTTNLGAVSDKLARAEAQPGKKEKKDGKFSFGRFFGLKKKA